MVELIVRDFEEETSLERALNDADIQYQIGLDVGNYGIKPPYLIVDGVPLDKKRAMIWVKEHGNNE